MALGLARKFAVVGIVIGTASALLWWYVRIFDPFHLPNVAECPPNYSAPFLYWIVNYSVFVLCPGTLLMIFTLEMRGWFSWFMWILAVLLNGPIYYAIGLVIDALLKRGDRIPVRFRKQRLGGPHLTSDKSGFSVDSTNPATGRNTRMK
jgi:hypothetical protein